MMEQLALFAQAGQSKGLPEHLLEYRPALLDTDESDQLIEKFILETRWKQTTQKLWDKEYLTPRLTCWYGDTDRISGSLPWTPELQRIRDKVEPLAGIRFNTVLLN